MRLSTITIYYVYELLILLFNLSGTFAVFNSILPADYGGRLSGISASLE
jgi:hypothetical protein